MSNAWESLAASSNGLYTVQDFAAAAYRLLTEQALYAADRTSRVVYTLIAGYERDFRAAFEPIGVELRVNRQLRYACAIPTHVPKTGTTPQDQTLLALTLRKIYDEGVQAGLMNDDGEVLCGLVELAEHYRLSTGRELPDKGRLDGVLRAMKRFGIARLVDGDNEVDYQAYSTANSDQPYAVAIRPAIADVLGEAALERLALWTRDASDTSGVTADTVADCAATDPNT